MRVAELELAEDRPDPARASSVDFKLSRSTSIYTWFLRTPVVSFSKATPYRRMKPKKTKFKITPN
jgi:hypothetical protein